MPTITYSRMKYEYKNEYKLYETFICLLEYNKFIYWNFPRALLVAESLLRIRVSFLKDIILFKDLIWQKNFQVVILYTKIFMPFNLQTNLY